MIAARQIFLGRGAGGGGWVNPYVTDGLIAMWDGEWNAGGGVHDASATTWVDISGNGHVLSMPAASAYTLSTNAVIFNGRGAAIGASSTDLLSVMSGTIEVLAQRSLESVSSPTRQIVEIGQQNVYWRGLGTNQGGPIGTTAYSSVYAGWRMYCIPNVETVSTPILASFLFDLDDEAPVSACFANGIQASRSYIYNWKAAAPTSFVPKVGTTSTYDGSTTIYCVRVYSRNLTASEIAANYAFDKVRFNLP